jgi:hypothetical protein
MTYRGVVSNGVVVLEGDKPAEGTVVEVTPVVPSAPKPTPPQQHIESLADLPAFGMWRDRTDLPQDSAEASDELRRRMMRRGS